MNDEQQPVTPPPEVPEAAGPPPAAEGLPPEEPERYPFWGYADLFLFAALAIPCMLLGWGVVKALSAVLHISFALHAAELLTEQFAGYALLFGALLLIFRMEYDRPFWKSLGWARPNIPMVWAIVAGLAAALSVAVISYLIRTPNTSNPMTNLMQDRASVFLLAVFGVTLGPLCEELAFRGFLQPLLVRSFGPVAGILGAAIPFGLLHFQEYGNSWRHALMIALAGAAFGWMRHATGSTRASTLMHAAYNSLFFYALLGRGVLR